MALRTSDMDSHGYDYEDTRSESDRASISSSGAGSTHSWGSISSTAQKITAAQELIWSFQSGDARLETGAERNRHLTTIQLLDQYRQFGGPSLQLSHTMSYADEQWHHQYLMACMHKGRHGMTLQQIRIDNITTDRQLFHFLRQQYSTHRGRLKRALSFRDLQGISFVKVSLLNPHRTGRLVLIQSLVSPAGG